MRGLLVVVGIEFGVRGFCRRSSVGSRGLGLYLGKREEGCLLVYMRIGGWMGGMVSIVWKW